MPALRDGGGLCRFWSECCVPARSYEVKPDENWMTFNLIEELQFLDRRASAGVSETTLACFAVVDETNDFTNYLVLTRPGHLARAALRAALYAPPARSPRRFSVVSEISCNSKVWTLLRSLCDC